MQKLIIALTAAILATGSTAASPQADVMSSVQRFVDGFNKGDTALIAAACAEQTSIIDEFPPFEWHGAGSCLRWMSDYDSDAKRNGITDGFVTIDKPRHVDIAGDRAYVVVPANYAYKKNGKPVQETGSMLAIALEKTANGWRFTGWSWAKN